MADPNIPEIPYQDTFNFRNDSILNTRLAMGKIIHGDAGNRCKIVFYGDSNFQGTNGNSDSNFYSTTSAAHWCQYWLNKFGCPAQQDNCFGISNGSASGSSSDQRIVWLGGATPNYGLTCLGGAVLTLSASGHGVTFTPNTATTYDHVDVWAYDGSAATVNVYLNGSNTATSTITLTGTGNMVNTTVAFTSTTVSNVSVKWATGTTYISAIDLWNSATPSVEVINAGVGGTASNLLIPSSTSGCSYWASLVALQPTLIFCNFSNNDFNNQTYTPAQVTANYKLGATAFQGYGFNFFPIIAAPYSSSYYPLETNQWRPMMHELCLQMNLPLADWSYRYPTTASIIGNPSNLHSPYYLYEDIGRRLAQLLFFGG